MTDAPDDHGALSGAALGLDRSATTLRAEADRLARLSNRMFTLWLRAERKEFNDGIDARIDARDATADTGNRDVSPGFEARAHDASAAIPEEKVTHIERCGE